MTELVKNYGENPIVKINPKEAKICKQKIIRIEKTEDR